MWLLWAYWKGKAKKEGEQMEWAKSKEQTRAGVSTGFQVPRAGWCDGDQIPPAAPGWSRTLLFSQRLRAKKPLGFETRSIPILAISRSDSEGSEADTGGNNVLVISQACGRLSREGGRNSPPTLGAPTIAQPCARIAFFSLTLGNNLINYMLASLVY